MAIIASNLYLLIFALKIPAIPGLSVGAIIGAIIAIFVQDISLGDMLSIMNNGFSTETGNNVTDELLNQGGIQSMMYTVSLILIALSFGATLEKARVLEAILGGMLRKIKRTGSLIGATAATCITSNIVGCDQFMSVVIPGRMYLNEYKKRGFHPKLLGRTLEDCGTVTACLLPWTTCGIFMFSVLKVSALDYAPYAFSATSAPSRHHLWLPQHKNQPPASRRTKITIDQTENSTVTT